MKPILLHTVSAAAWLLGSPGIVLAGPVEQKGTHPDVTHFIFRPLQTLDVSGVVRRPFWKQWELPKT